MSARNYDAGALKAAIAESAGLVDVVLNNNNGASSLQDAFSYSAPLVVAALPGKGTTQGSTSVTLMGSGFVPGTTTVLFGQDPG